MLTIKEIITATQETAPYFFDAATLKGFGQSVEDFTVAQSPKGNIYIYAPSYWGKPIGNSHLRISAFGTGVHRHSGNHYNRLEGKELMGYTFRQFDGNALKTCDCSKDLESVLEYIEKN